MECFFQCIFEGLAACCGVAADSFTERKRLRKLLGALGVVWVLAIAVTAAVGITCACDGQYTAAVILFSVAGGLLLACIALGIAAEVNRRKRKKRLRETTETDGNEYRACVQCDAQGVTVDLAEKIETAEQDAEKGEDNYA